MKYLKHVKSVANYEYNAKAFPLGPKTWGSFSIICLFPGMIFFMVLMDQIPNAALLWKSDQAFFLEALITYLIFFFINRFSSSTYSSRNHCDSFVYPRRI